mgnify:CR=1 FL=1
MSRRLSATLEIEADEIRCRKCAHGLGPTGHPWKPAAALVESPMRGAAGVPYSGGENVLLRRFSCPSCGALLDTETAMPGDPFLDDVLFD